MKTLVYGMDADYFILLAVLIVAMFLSVWAKKLTAGAALTGGLLGLFIYAGAGFTGIVMTAVFFLLGSVATAWGMGFKESSGLAELNKGRRKAGQVLANAGMAAILGLMVLIFPRQQPLLQLMMAATFASATGDTLSSELGNVYGRRFYNIFTFKKDSRGLNGVISLEGTLFGIAGSVVIAAIYAVGFSGGIYILWIVIAGTIGNFCDSFLGATLERRHVIGNNWVNFLNTLCAAVVMLLLYSLL